MAFKRALWTSGYNYRITCPYCRAVRIYTDRELDFRPWYPDGFVYCPRCRKPLRHNEIYAIHPDGSPVYSNRGEADMSIREGYYNAYGVNQPVQQPQYPQAQQPVPPVQQPAPPMQQPAQEPQQPAQDMQQPVQEQQPAQAFCTNCGRPYTIGTDHFCSGCGTKLD